MILSLLLFFFASLVTSSFHRVERTEVFEPSVGYLDFGVIEPNARSVRIHFSKFDIPVDSAVLLFNVETNEQHRFEGWRKGSFLALSLFGNRATLSLDLGSGSWKETHSIVVDYIQVETDDASRRSLPQLCDQWHDFMEGNVKNTECAHNLGSSADRNIKSVVKIQFGNGGFATGFFFGAYNRILTNKHVIGNPEDAKDAEIEIQYECTSCNGDAVNCQYKQVYKVQVRSLLWSNDLLDAALLNLDYNCPNDLPIEIVAPFDEISSGFFPAPTEGTHIYIVHHPNGQPKKITHNDDGQSCQIIHVTNENIFTNCDTYGGSSGAPIFRKSDHKLIGLNWGYLHSGSDLDAWHNDASNVLEDGECAQIGSRMDEVWAQMQPTQFKCCATFATNLSGGGDKWRICDDVPYVPNEFNDKFSSVKLTTNCKMITYKDDHFGGSYKSFNSDSWTNLGSMNNKITSMRFRRTDPGRCRVKFYEDSHQQGKSVMFTGDQAVLYKWNDIWSSFKILETGCKLFLYRDMFFRDLIGTYDDVSPDDQISANDQVSSFRIIPYSDACEVKLYKNSGCTGTPRPESVDVDWFDSHWNDKVMSVEIKNGCGVILYEDDDFGGDFEHFEIDKWSSLPYQCKNLQNTVIKNRASSLKVYKVARQINRRLLKEEQQN